MFRMIKLATIGWMAFKWLRRGRGRSPGAVVTRGR